jgi:hypothetical protein
MLAIRGASARKYVVSLTTRLKLRLFLLRPSNSSGWMTTSATFLALAAPSPAAKTPTLAGADLGRLAASLGQDDVLVDAVLRDRQVNVLEQDGKVDGLRELALLGLAHFESLGDSVNGGLLGDGNHLGQCVRAVKALLPQLGRHRSSIRPFSRRNGGFQEGGRAKRSSIHASRRVQASRPDAVNVMRGDRPSALPMATQPRRCKKSR